MRNSGNGVLWRFADFYRRAKKWPKFTVADQERMLRLEGLAIEELLKGGSKVNFLEERKRIDRIFQASQRFFYVLRPEELEECLFLATGDRSYARGQREHELEHYELFLNFLPADKRDLPPEVLFSILVTTDGAVTPCTNSCRRIFPYTIWPLSWRPEGLLKSAKKDPTALFKAWDVETIRQFYRYKRRNVTNGSEGDCLILRN